MNPEITEYAKRVFARMSPCVVDRAWDSLLPAEKDAWIKRAGKTFIDVRVPQSFADKYLSGVTPMPSLTPFESRSGSKAYDASVDAWRCSKPPLGVLVVPWAELPETQRMLWREQYAVHELGVMRWTFNCEDDYHTMMIRTHHAMCAKQHVPDGKKILDDLKPTERFIDKYLADKPAQAEKEGDSAEHTRVRFRTAKELDYGREFVVKMSRDEFREYLRQRINTKLFSADSASTTIDSRQLIDLMLDFALLIGR